MIGFGFSVFTQAILGLGGGFRGSALNLDFTSGSRTLDPRITFSRTTNATLTNSAGLVANAPMNLVTFSEQFDNAAWTKTDTTITANAIASPDGTLTADKLVETATTAGHRVATPTFTATAGSTYTVSIYAKAAERSFVYARTNLVTTDTNAAWFNLESGTVGTVAAGFSASISSVGDGWFRCVVTCTQTGTPTTRYVGFGVSTADNVFSYTGDGTSGIFIWGAQLELGSTATTYNPTTVKNLLGFTEHFDNAAWTKSNASISATKVDDIYGQPFAQKLVESTATGFHYALQQVTTVVGTTYTNTIYLKAAERSRARLEIVNSAGSVTYVINANLATGTFTASGAGSPTSTSASMTPIGDGWYRVSVAMAAPSTATQMIVYVQNDAGNVSYTGDGTSGIYIFGAQLSDSASVDPYVYQPVAAPSSVAYYGPRFDYDPVTLAPKGLLIEEQRTNLLTYSQDFTNASWSKINGSITSTTEVAPDGTNTASVLTASAANAELYKSVVLASGTAYTSSFYLKRKTGTGTVSIRNSANTAWIPVTINSTTWTRVTNDSGNSGGSAFADILVSVSGNEVYIWGAQLEAGAFATSYIPTAASQVTRAADSASMIGNNFARWYNQTEGTLFSDFDWFGLTSNDYCFSIGTDGNNSIGLGVNTSGLSRFLVISGGASQANYSFSALTPNVPLKLAGAYKLNDFNAAAAGTLGTTDTSGTVPIATSAQFNSSVGGGNDFNGHLKRIAYYNRRLSNSELQAITS